MTTGDAPGPTLSELVPVQSFEAGSRRFVKLARFHGSQKLNLMRATRLPANSRKYNHGDPVNLIDWRVFARTEQLTVKEQQDEASCAVTLVVHGSDTMKWPNQEILENLDSQCCSKLELACRIAFHLAYQALKAGDRVRIYYIFGEDIFLLVLRTQVEVLMIFEKIISKNFDFLEGLSKQSFGLIERERADFFYWISDGLGGFPNWISPHRHKYSCWIHTLSSLEMSDRWFDQDNCYFDEDRDLREYLGSQLKNERSFEEAILKWQTAMRKQWLLQHRNYLLVTEAMSIKTYLKSMQKLWEFPEGPNMGDQS